MWQAEVGGDARRDCDGPVDPRRDDAVDALGPRELAEGGSSSAETIARRSAYAKPGAAGVAVAGDDEEAALPRRAQKPELSRAGP